MRKSKRCGCRGPRGPRSPQGPPPLSPFPGPTTFRDPGFHPYLVPVGVSGIQAILQGGGGGGGGRGGVGGVTEQMSRSSPLLVQDLLDYRVEMVVEEGQGVLI